MRLLVILLLSYKASENQDVTTEVISQPKGEKSLKPASFRVREAAESVLSCIMEHVGAFPSPCGPASSSSLIDEDILMEFLPEDEQVILDICRETIKIAATRAIFAEILCLIFSL